MREHYDYRMHFFSFHERHRRSRPLSRPRGLRPIAQACRLIIAREYSRTKSPPPPSAPPPQVGSALEKSEAASSLGSAQFTKGEEPEEQLRKEYRREDRETLWFEAAESCSPFPDAEPKGQPGGRDGHDDRSYRPSAYSRCADPCGACADASAPGLIWAVESGRGNVICFVMGCEKPLSTEESG